MLALTRRTLLQGTICGAVTAAGAVLPAWAQEVAEGASPKERLAMAAIAEAYMKEHAIPGLSVAIARKGRLVYQQGFGLADAATGEAVTPAHRFRIASISKPVTSAAIFTLVERGRLRLDDKVFGEQGILRTGFGAKPYGTGIEAITVEHLLTHTMGGWPNQKGDPMTSNLKMNHRELISWTLDNRPLAAAPGTAFAYSNFGYFLLGRVIEKVTGEAYPAYVQRAVLAPCKITGMQIGGNTPAERAMPEVTYQGLKGQRDPYRHNVARLESCGGWIATARDLVQFGMHLDGRFGVQPLLKPATVAVMTAPTAANKGYAKGWRIRGGNWWHTGHLTGGTFSELMRTQAGFCWAALCNARPVAEKHVSAFENMAFQMIRSVRGWNA